MGKMEVVKIFAIGDEGLDDPAMDQELECNPATETLEGIRQKIADNVLLSDTPDKVTLIKRGKDQDDEEELEKLDQTLSDVLDEGDSLRFLVETFARVSVKITLSVEPKAIEWIAKNSKEFKFLVGNNKDYQEFPLDKSETEFTVMKKSWWKWPTQAKVAVGHTAGEGFLASQFVVNNGDALKVCLEDHELKFLINKEKKVGETKRYALDKTNYGKYIAKVGAKVLPIVGNVVVNLLM